MGLKCSLGTLKVDGTFRVCSLDLCKTAKIDTVELGYKDLLGSAEKAYIRGPLEPKLEFPESHAKSEQIGLQRRM